MILQALVDCYEALSASGKIARPGWGPVKTSIALELTETGEISQAIFLKEEVEKGKKKEKRFWFPRFLICLPQSNER